MDKGRPDGCAEDRQEFAFLNPSGPKNGFLEAPERPGPGYHTTPKGLQFLKYVRNSTTVKRIRKHSVNQL